MIVNSNSLGKHVLQIKNKIMINVSANKITRMKKIIIGILAHVIVSVVSI